MINFTKKKTDNIIDKLYEKIKNYKSKEINLEKDEYKSFINFLINNK